MDRNVIIVLVLFGLLAGCSSEPRLNSVSEYSDPGIVGVVGGQAAEIYRSRCSTCHGIAGRGNGPAAQSLAVSPRDFTESQWQSSVTNEAIRTTIVHGGVSVGKSALMPPNSDLATSAQILNGLIRIIRGLESTGTKGVSVNSGPGAQK